MSQPRELTVFEKRDLIAKAAKAMAKLILDTTAWCGEQQNALDKYKPSTMSNEARKKFQAALKVLFGETERELISGVVDMSMQLSPEPNKLTDFYSKKITLIEELNTKLTDEFNYYFKLKQHPEHGDFKSTLQIKPSSLDSILQGIQEAMDELKTLGTKLQGQILEVEHLIKPKPNPNTVFGASAAAAAAAPANTRSDHKAGGKKPGGPTV